MHGFICILGVFLCIPSAQICLQSDLSCAKGQQCSKCDSDGKCVPECFVGYYGSKCNHACSHGCLNNTCKLNTQTGVDECSHGCQLGFYGRRCRVPCINSTGCKRCASGCVGSFCVQDVRCWANCYDSHFGSQCKACSNQCELCNYATGECQTCSSGCNHGECDLNGECKRGCLQGFYGRKCIQCHPGCNGTCDTHSGHCADGCKNGYYGWNCTLNCGTCTTGVCEQQTGLCVVGCNSTYDNDCGKLCKENCSTHDKCQTSKWCSDTTASSTAESVDHDTVDAVESYYMLYVGIILAVQLLIVILLMLFFLLRKTRLFCLRRRVSNVNVSENVIVAEEMCHMDTRYEPLQRYWEINYTDTAASQDVAQSSGNLCEDTCNSIQESERDLSADDLDIIEPRDGSEEETRAIDIYGRYLSPCLPEPL